MESRLQKEAKKIEPGPAITISREMGCPAKPVSERLKMMLNEGRNQGPFWKCLSNELLEEAAGQLKVDPRYIRHVFTYNDRNTLDEIIAATKKEHRYKSDRAIKNSVGRVIKALGEEGHYIIIGRGGVAHTRHIQKSLHIKLIAPIEWRIQKIMEFKNISWEEASVKVQKGDYNRQQFLRFYLGDSDLSDHFDLTLNCSSFKVEELAVLINEAFKKVVMSPPARISNRKLQPM